MGKKLREELKCLNKHSQSVEGTLKDLKPSPNLDYTRPSLHSNQTNSGQTALITLTMCVFLVITLLLYKYANKILHRNENADRDLPMNQLGNKKTRRRSSIKDTESLCLKLANCVGSYEQNCKRGY